MPNVLIRNVPLSTVSTLKERAKIHGRSLQAEMLSALTNGARCSGNTLAGEIEALVHRATTPFDVSVALSALRNDRAR